MKKEIKINTVFDHCIGEIIGHEEYESICPLTNKELEEKLFELGEML